MSALLAVSRLEKDFGARALLRIDRLEIEQGGAYLLTGANGSGKTTLLRILSGLEPARAGEFRFREQALALMPYPERPRREVVYVHQHPYLFQTSLRHNLEYGLRCRGVPAAERARRVAEAIAWAGMEALRAAPPAKLSGGEKQRVALARARALEPELLLLDEPTANLDEDGRRRTLALLERLRDERRTVVVACHDAEVIALEGFARLHLADGEVALAATER